MFRHYCVIIRELVVSTFPSYTSMSNAVVGNTIYNFTYALCFRISMLKTVKTLKLSYLCMYIPGQYNGSIRISIRTVYTATTQTDFMGIITDKMILVHFIVNRKILILLMILNIVISTT